MAKWRRVQSKENSEREAAFEMLLRRATEVSKLRNERLHHNGRAREKPTTIKIWQMETSRINNYEHVRLTFHNMASSHLLWRKIYDPEKTFSLDRQKMSMACRG